ncbi:STAS/SEC14 domain-containing protein [Psychromarinibacter halotolerans]|uniref:STAS/SEC14 domain-containing protein n=1 Tax=Psychromarinibacter halotolerans TaxID=1775175 RepID=A0ABV7GK59_9RHOB|nr:STAS/SEC14 domain-containing protein [Psychromarinibacter halotolerans]MDF0595583.1 STAS/SEC14 domain-containing protein [Psychromarinibacter halotolerans]
MSVGFTEHPKAGYVEIVVDGTVGKADFDAIMPRLEAFIAAQGEISVLKVVRGIGFVNLPAALGNAWSGLQTMSRLRRAALVTDLPWLVPFAGAAAMLSPVETRVFGLAELEEARAWVSEKTPAGPQSA